MTAKRHEFTSPNYLISARTFGNLYMPYHHRIAVAAHVSPAPKATSTM